MKINILAGIVLYNPDIKRLKENISSIINQVEEVILVDNNSQNIEEIKSIIGQYDNLYFVRNSTNEGIAYALNQILNYAYSHKYTWYLTLDQDSVVPCNIINSYTNNIQNGCALMTCRIVDRNFLIENTSKEIENVETCITSACFTNTEICKKLGGYDNKLFIDSVDHELCIRVRKAGYTILKINSISLIHELGHSKKVKLLGNYYIVYNHTPLRSFYIFRNRVYIGRKYKMLTSSMKYLLIRLILISLFENGKIKKLRYATKGIYEGLNMKISQPENSIFSN